jgi:hypothetical protein
MTSRYEPIPFEARRSAAKAAEVGDQLGRTIGEWVREIGAWRRSLQRAQKNTREFWSEVKEPIPRERHVWKLVAGAAVAGVAIGILLGRRD